MDPDDLLDAALDDFMGSEAGDGDAEADGAGPPPLEPAAESEPVVPSGPSPTSPTSGGLLETIESFQRPFYNPSDADLKDENNSQEALSKLVSGLFENLFEELQRLTVLQNNKQAVLLADFSPHRLKSKDIRVDVGQKSVKIELTGSSKTLFSAEFPDTVEQDEPWTLSENEGSSMLELTVNKSAEGVWEVPFEYPLPSTHPAVLSDSEIAQFDSGLEWEKKEAAEAGKAGATGAAQAAEEAETEPMPADEASMAAEALVEKAFRSMQGGDIKAAVHYLRCAALHHDHAPAADLLSRMYDDSDTKVADPEKATKFLELGAQLGAPLSLLRLADAYRNSDWTKRERSFEQSYRLYQRAALAGHPHGMLQCASMLLQLTNNAQSILAPPSAEIAKKFDDNWTTIGLTRARSIRLALAWIFEAARRGYAQAYIYIYRVAFTGCERIGIPVSVKPAMTSLRMLQMGGAMGELQPSDQELYKRNLPRIEALAKEAKKEEEAKAAAAAAAKPAVAARDAEAAKREAAPVAAMPVATRSQGGAMVPKSVAV